LPAIIVYRRKIYKTALISIINTPLYNGNKKMNKKLMIGSIAFLIFMTMIDLAYAMSFSSEDRQVKQAADCEEGIYDDCQNPNDPEALPEFSTIGTALAIAGTAIYASLKKDRTEKS
jgi:hypothetical protein